jgi:hypothetical protein
MIGKIERVLTRPCTAFKRHRMPYPKESRKRSDPPVLLRQPAKVCADRIILKYAVDKLMVLFIEAKVLDKMLNNPIRFIEVAAPGVRRNIAIPR